MGWGKVGEMVVALGVNNDQLKKGLKESTDLISSTMNTISSMKSELLSMGAVAGPISSIQKWAAAVNDLTDKTNMAGESASKLLAVGQYVGLSADEMSGAMAKMSKAAFSAAESINVASASGQVSSDVFSKFGIQITDANGVLLSAEQILTNVTNVHRNMANGVAKNALEMEIFGRTGTKLNDLLNLTEIQMRDVAQAAEKSGLVLSTDQTQAWEDAGFAVNKAKLQMQGLTVAIAREMLPEFDKLTKTLDSVTEWFSSLDSESKKNIATSLELAAAASALSIGWRGLVFVAGPLIGSIVSISNAYKALAVSANSARIAMLATGIGAATGIAAAIYSAVDKYNHYADGGEFEINDMGDVTKKEKVKSPADLKREQDNLKVETQAPPDGYIPPEIIPTSSVGSIGGNTKDKSSNQSLKEISDLNKDLAKFSETTKTLANDYAKMVADYAASQEVGSAAIIGNIEREYDRRKESITDWLSDVSKATKEAEAMYERALATDDSEAINKAAVIFEEQKQLQIKKADEAAKELARIDADKNRELMANYTAVSRFRADLDEEMRTYDLEGFRALLATKQAEEMLALEEKQSMMQIYMDWEAEAHKSNAMTMMEMQNMAKDGLANSFGQAIIGANTLGQSLKNLTKQLIAYYITDRAQSAISAAFGMGLKEKEAAKSSVMAAKASAEWTPPAVAYETVHPGSALRAAGAVTTAMATSTMAAVPGKATGGLVSGPGSSTSDSILTRLSDGEYVVQASAVRALGADTLDSINNGQLPTISTPILSGIDFGKMFIDSGRGASAATAITQNIYGDINSGADYEDMWDDLNDMFAGALRGV